MQKKGFFGK